MTLHVPIGHVLSRACLAGAGLALLATAARSAPCNGALAPARTVATARSEGPIHRQRHAALGRPMARRVPLGASESVLLPGVHPVGLSSEGEPDDCGRHLSTHATSAHARQ